MIAHSITQVSPQDLSADRRENSRMLLEIPGLVDVVTPQIGSAIFIPHLEGDVGKELHCLNLDIDGRPMQFFKPVNAVTRPSLTVYPGLSFDHTGTAYLFRHSGIPLIYRQMVVGLAVFQRDPSVLEVVFTPHEIEHILPEFHERLKICGSSPA